MIQPQDGSVAENPDFDLEAARKGLVSSSQTSFRKLMREMETVIEQSEQARLAKEEAEKGVPHSLSENAQVQQVHAKVDQVRARPDNNDDSVQMQLEDNDIVLGRNF